MNIDLNEILSAVAKGRLSATDAKAQIEKAFGRRPEKVDRPEAPEGVKESLIFAFDKFRKSVHVDELLKMSSGLVHQIAENMPGQFERFQENLSHNFGAMNALGFSAGTPGVDAKLSVFRTFHVGADALVEANQVVGSQWFGVNFDDAAEVRSNKFTAVQFSEVAVLRSTLDSNNLGLSRLSNVTFQESRIAENRLSRSTFSDVSLVESDFEKCRLVKSEISQTVINSSRLFECTLDGTSFAECEFDGCDLEGVTFENCSFRECAFEGVELSAGESVRIVGINLTGRSFRRVRSMADFLEMLGSAGAGLDEKDPDREEPGSASPASGSARSSRPNRSRGGAKRRAEPGTEA